MEVQILHDRQITLYRGDCLEVMPTLEAQSIDLVLTDPPYNSTKCDWDHAIPLDQMWQDVHRLATKNAALVFFSSQPFTSRLVLSNIDNFQYEWIWDKNAGLGFFHSKYKPLKQHENLVVFSLGKSNSQAKVRTSYNPQSLIPTDKQNSNGPISTLGYVPKKEIHTTHKNYPKSILSYSRVKGYHPTQKPVALLEYLIRTYTNEGDTVLDFTMGSGSTGVACRNTNRKFIGIELDAAYYNIAVERCSK
jgi:site-specific DNA-methyltransferase (adenine-specific)